MRSCFTIPALLIGLVVSAAHLPAQRFNGLTLSNPFTDGATTGSRIGVALRDIDADRAAALKLGNVTGAEVMAVESGSPAEQAGIKAGDVLLSYNNESIVGAQQLGRLVSETPVGRKVKIEYSRDGKVTTAIVTTAMRPTHALTLANPGFDPNFGPGPNDIFLASSTPSPHFSWSNPQLGIECEGLDARNSQLAEFFGVKRGVLVRSVVKESAAAKAGLRAGDVITQVSGHPVGDPKEIIYYIRQEQHLAKPFPLEVMRNHKESTVKISFPSDSQE